MNALCRLLFQLFYLVFMLILQRNTQGFDFREKTGLCPLYAPVPKNDKSCQLTTECDSDYTCPDRKKCCENSCGVTQCIDPLPVVVHPVHRQEKCPVQITPSGTCNKEQTKFCYKDDCKRCCIHETKCNPTPGLLATVEACYRDLCKKHVCNQQGTLCIVDQQTNEPTCNCKKSCPKVTNYVCGMDGITYNNHCYLNREACKRMIEIKLKGSGICPAVDSSQSGAETKLPPPNIRPNTRITIESGGIAWFICEVPKDGATLKWFKRRSYGDIPMPEKVTFMNDVNIKGKALFLRLDKITRGNRGVYVCKQTFNDSVSEATARLIVTSTGRLADPKIICRQPVSSGPCYGDFRNFYYDPIREGCVEFRYSGCHGNENNFEIKEDCEAKCKGMKSQASFCGQKPTSSDCAANKNDECKKDTDCRPGSRCCFIGCSRKCIQTRSQSGTLVSEPCGKQICKHYSTCHLTVDGGKVCACRRSCNLDYNPVCGNDGKTYYSECIMKVRACRWQKNIYVKQRKPCSKAPTSNTIVTCATLKANDECLPYAKCVINPLNNLPTCLCPYTCNFTPKFVCGTDGKSYPNKCMMQAISCKRGILIKVHHDGPCIFKYGIA